MAEGKILLYLDDIPLQHASPRIREADEASRLRLTASWRALNKWREICPDRPLRSTFIVGFPGETEEDFQMLLDFLKEGASGPRKLLQVQPV